MYDRMGFGGRGPHGFGHGGGHGHGPHRPHGRGHGHHVPWGDGGGLGGGRRGGGGGGPFGGGPFGGGPRGGGGRVRRGEARYVLLDALRDSPKHGYEIIKALEERSEGRYAPSAGTVYPTLQYLEDLGWVSADASGERRVYSLTDVGRAELDTHAAEIEAFWSQIAGPVLSASSQTEIRFLKEEMDDIRRTLWGGLRTALEKDDPEPIRAVRRALERCKNEIREIIANNASDVV